MLKVGKLARLEDNSSTVCDCNDDILFHLFYMCCAGVKETWGALTDKDHCCQVLKGFFGQFGGWRKN